MAITSFEDLSPLGQIIYTKYKSGGFNSTQVNAYVTKGKITSDEATFILA